MMMCRDGWVPPDEKCDAEMEESLEDSPWAKQPDAREAEVVVLLIDSSLIDSSLMSRLCSATNPELLFCPVTEVWSCHRAIPGELLLLFGSLFKGL